MGIVLCLGIAVSAVILAVENGREASNSPTDRSGRWEVTTDIPEEKIELPEQKLDLPEEEAAAIRVDPPSQTKRRNPEQVSSRAESKAPSESVGTAPQTVESKAPEAESPEQTNSAEAHPDDRGVTFTRDNVNIELNPGGDGGDQQGSDDDNADDRDEDEEDEEEENGEG